MTRDEVARRGARALVRLVSEHGDGNRFLASELQQWDSALRPMIVGRFGVDIACAATDALHTPVMYERTDNPDGGSRARWSYFVVADDATFGG